MQPDCPFLGCECREDTIGGTDVRDFKLDSLMKNISMVFQSVYLFADTIENNIKFGCPDATHEQVVEAAKKACCHNFISALPDGYDTVISEGGGTLSGGEKQRISIARAMLKDAPIIILDEASLMKQMAEKQGVTEQVKMQDQMKWVGLMNDIKACAEEIVLREGIYVSRKGD